MEGTHGERIPTSWWHHRSRQRASSRWVPQVARAVLCCAPAACPMCSPSTRMHFCRMLAVHTDAGSLVPVHSGDVHRLLAGIRTGQRLRLRGRWAAPSAAATNASSVRAAAAVSDQVRAGFQAVQLETLDSGPAITPPTLAYAPAAGSGAGGVVRAAAAGDRITLSSNKMPSTSKDITTLVIPSRRPMGVGCRCRGGT